jgi:hypothetical protein
MVPAVFVPGSSISLHFLLLAHLNRLGFAWLLSFIYIQRANLFIFSQPTEKQRFLFLFRGFWTLRNNIFVE